VISDHHYYLLFKNCPNIAILKMRAFQLNAADINDRILLPECLQANKKAPKIRQKKRGNSPFFY